jgi:hypothetical protein
MNFSVKHTSDSISLKLFLSKPRTPEEKLLRVVTTWAHRLEPQAHTDFQSLTHCSWPHSGLPNVWPSTSLLGILYLNTKGGWVYPDQEGSWVGQGETLWPRSSKQNCWVMSVGHGQKGIEYPREQGCRVRKWENGMGLNPVKEQRNELNPRETKTGHSLLLEGGR